MAREPPARSGRVKTETLLVQKLEMFCGFRDFRLALRNTPEERRSHFVVYFTTVLDTRLYSVDSQVTGQ
jgi:hypothetical protein